MPVGVPVTAFWGVSDRRVTRDMVAAWRRFVVGGDGWDGGLVSSMPSGTVESCRSAAGVHANSSANGGERRHAAQFELVEVAGNHLFPLQPAARAAWFKSIISRLQSYSITN